MKKKVLNIISIFIVLTAMTGITFAVPGTPPGPPASIVLEAVPATVQADGISYSTIIATLSDSNGQPSPGANVYFTTNFGSLSTNYGSYPQGWLDISDSQGKAYATITSASTGTATVTAVSGSLTKTVSVAFTTQDVTPPVISNIAASGITQNSTTITWNTNEPADSIVKYGTSSGVYTNTQADSALIMAHSIGLTGLTPGTTYYYVVNSTDASGNSAQSSEGSFTTQSPPVDITPPSVTNPSANPNEILLEDEEAGNADYQHMSTTLSATATDASGIASVSIDLSSIGGNPAAVMAPVGGNVYSITTNATGSPGSKSLGVTATDARGNSNASVSILLNVLRNGDVDGSGAVNLDDAIYLANHVLQVPGFEVINTIASDVDGSGAVNLDDAIYLANHVLQVPGFEKLY